MRIAQRQIFAMAVMGSVLIGPAGLSSAQTGQPPMNDVDRDALIFERQQIMEKLGRDSELLGKIVAGIEPPAKLSEATRAIAVGARESLEIFRMPVPGGRAKSEIWVQDSNFPKRMEAFARNAEAMAKAGESGSVQAVTELMIDALPCKECHTDFRKPAKP